MGDEVNQITIPDFDDDEFSSSSIPFGRGAGAFGFGGSSGFSSSGAESPTLLTPTAPPPPEKDFPSRDYFHSRNDSAASEDSSISVHGASTPFAARSNTSIPAAHSSQTSLPSSNPPAFTKKSSFASLKQAFKGSVKAAEAPPVPSLDRQAYPAALRNPFNRSTTSLATSTTAVSSSMRSPPSIDKHARGQSSRYARGQQPSQSGSVFHASDAGSDYSFGFHHIAPRQTTPPPVPRVPRFNGPSDEEGLSSDPKTPSEYALHAIFIQFAAMAEDKIDRFLKIPLDRNPVLVDVFGQDVDANFDELLVSLGQIASKSPKRVIDSIMRWRRSQQESVSGDLIVKQSSSSSQVGRTARPKEVANLLNERKSLASIYIMCRALLATLQSVSRDALGESTGFNLEETIFAQFKQPDLKVLTQSANHRVNAELYAMLLGRLSSIRFESVTDLFIHELAPVANNQVLKDMEPKYEILVKTLRHVELKVWPPEAFEEGADFMEAFSKVFDKAHGSRLKIAFAETLVQLLHPIGKTAQAEVNHPGWAKAMELVFNKARDMMSKPRYWQVAYPLAITCMCVAPQDIFLKNWYTCFEAGIAKVKERPLRAIVMNGTMRLVWTYLYRCRESTSATTGRLELLLKHFFPASRASVSISDDQLEPLICIVHFILARHFDFGSEVVLSLIQEQHVKSAQTGSVSLVLAPERTCVAVEAAVRTLCQMEREEAAPSWPSSLDFSISNDKDDYPISAMTLPTSILAKPGMQDFFDRCSSTLVSIAVACAKSVGRMSIFDDQYAYVRANNAYEDASGLIIRKHPEATVAYSASYSGQMSILCTCFSAWPRLLHPSLPLDEALDMLIRAIVHVEPSVGEAASGALARIANEPAHLSRVLSRFALFLFSPKQFTAEATGTRLPYESFRLLEAWCGIVKAWADAVMTPPGVAIDENDNANINARFFDVERAAIFLLSSRQRAARTIGARLLRLLKTIVDHFHDQPSTPIEQVVHESFGLVDVLLDNRHSEAYLDGYDFLLDAKEVAHLSHWQQSNADQVLMRIACSESGMDRDIWWNLYPSIVRGQAARQSKVIMSCRELWIAASTRYHSAIVSVSGLVSRQPVSQNGRTAAPLSMRERERIITDNEHLIEQWHMWVKLTCCTAAPAESRAAMQHARIPSEAVPSRDLVSTDTRGLFRYLIPFLDSEHPIFRNIAVICISAFPPESYKDLLDDLGTYSARHIYTDNQRSRMSPTIARRSRRQDRVHFAVAHIYQLTAHHLKHQRGVARQDSLTNVLKFVRHTQAFLSVPEVRRDWQQQRLRRYFCGIVERLFDGLATLQSSDRFIPANMHLTLYRLCEDWCQCGSQSERVKQQLIEMQTSATTGFADSQGKAGAIAQFQTETKLLSHASTGAMAALLQKAFYPPDMSSNSPMELLTTDFGVPLEIAPTLDRIVAMLASMHDAVRSHGRKALRSLVDHERNDDQFLDEVLRRSFVTSMDTETSGYRFFEIVADVVCNGESCRMSFGHVFCLGMANLCSPLVNTRRLALAAVEAAHRKLLSATSASGLSSFEAGVGSSAATVYLDAQLGISEHLAEFHPDEAVNIVAHVASKLAMVYDVLAAYAFSHMLAALAPWFKNVHLLVPDNTSLTREGRVVLYHLMSLTIRYSETYPEQVHALWNSLVEDDHSNAHATIRFLLEQSAKVGSSGFVSCARRIIACLSRTSCGLQAFEGLCEVIEPVRMLPTIDHKLMFPDHEEADLWADLDALFAEQPKHSLGSGQFALLFLGDVAIPRAWEFKKQLPVLLQGIFTHVGHRNPFVRDHARQLLFQLLRSWLLGYDELPTHNVTSPLATLRQCLADLEKDSSDVFWTEDDSISRISDKMRNLCNTVVQWLQPLHVDLANDWGSLALLWGTTCSIRPIAFRSLQVFRSLMPEVTQADLAQLLGRLSNTIAAHEYNIHPFTVELLITLSSVVKSSNVDSVLLPQLYWCALACLSTPVEVEYQQILDMLDNLMSKLDLKDAYTAQVLVANKPAGFRDEACDLQKLLLVGLRSIHTYKRTLDILARLSDIDDPTLMKMSAQRLRDLYVMILPLCLQQWDGDHDPAVTKIAENVARFAERDNLTSIARIMTSVTKSRFRTRDDFMRQAAASLREHYAASQWTEVVSLLMSLVLNNEKWLRVKSMQFLKVLFGLRETRDPVDRLGSELLMPLLRLLQTELAPQALEVLDEPLSISGGGIPARQVLRMSMHVSSFMGNDMEVTTEVFGMPEESGWSVARPDRQRDLCRANVMAVFDTCKMPTRPSCIEFEPDVDRFIDPFEDDLGDLVQNLHELSTFFLGDPESSTENEVPAVPLPTLGENSPSMSVPSHRLEARVAAILAKSTDGATTMDSPQTPFVDVFHVNAGNGATNGLHHGFDGSDEDSDSSDFENDTFAYDDTFANGSSSGHHGHNDENMNGYFGRKTRRG